MSRLFSEQELDEFATPLSIHLERAANARDLAKLDWIVEEMNRECLAIYDPYVHWLGALQSFIVDRAGQAEHNRALTWVAEYAVRPFARRYEGLDARARAAKLAERLRASGSTFWVEEDEERIRFRMEPWGPERWTRGESDGEARSWEGPSASADRLRYPRFDYYGGGPISFAELSGPGPLTQGRPQLPAHLALEVLFLEIVPIELFGFPIAAIEFGAGEEPTYLDVYKNPADVPASVYERVGTVKPKSGLDLPDSSAPLSDEERERLAKPLSLQVQEAGAGEDHDELLRISAGMDAELVVAKDPWGVAIAGLLSWIAWHLGEDAAEQALARSAEVVMAPFIAVVRDLEIKDAIPAWAMSWRSHGSTFWIEERDETFAFRGRPLGACHRMFSSAYQPEVERISESRVRYPTFGVYDAPNSFHMMREPRGITYGKSDYPLYSCHCHMLHEIYPIDQIGRPLWIEEHNLDDPDGEMFHIHYKDPSAWPELYYERVGRSKP